MKSVLSSPKARRSRRRGEFDDEPRDAESVAGDQLHDPRQLIADAFVLLSLPGLVLSLLDLVGREGAKRRLSWTHRIAGAVVLAVGVLFVLGFVG